MVDERVLAPHIVLLNSFQFSGPVLCVETSRVHERFVANLAQTDTIQPTSLSDEIRHR